jgi:hypothetical protein
LFRRKSSTFCGSAQASHSASVIRSPALSRTRATHRHPRHQDQRERGHLVTLGLSKPHGSLPLMRTTGYSRRGGMSGRQCRAAQGPCRTIQLSAAGPEVTAGLWCRAELLSRVRSAADQAVGQLWWKDRTVGRRGDVLLPGGARKSRVGELHPRPPSAGYVCALHSSCCSPSAIPRKPNQQEDRRQARKASLFTDRRGNEVGLPCPAQFLLMVSPLYQLTLGTYFGRANSEA